MGTSIAPRAGTPPDRRVAGRARGRRGGGRPPGGSRPTAIRDAPSGSRRCRSRSLPSRSLVAAEEGVVDLDAAAGPPGSTVRHLLAHASGLPFEGATPTAAPGEADLLQRGLPRARGAPRAAVGDVVLRVRASRRVQTRSASGSIRAAIRLRDAGLARRRPLARPRAAGPDPRRARDAGRDDERPVPGARASSPTSAASSRSTGASASSLKRPSRPGWGSACRRGRSATSEARDVPLGRSRGPRRLRRAHESRVRRLGEGRLADALRLGPRGARLRPSRRRRRRTAAARARRTWPGRSSRPRTASSPSPSRCAGCASRAPPPPKNSPARRMRRSPSEDCDTPATPETRTKKRSPGCPSRTSTVLAGTSAAPSGPPASPGSRPGAWRRARHARAR